LLPVLALAGCEYAEPVRGPDGDANWWTIHCRHDKGRCYAMAAEKCPTGYAVADSSERHGAVSFSSTQGTVNGTANTYGSTTYVHGTYQGTSNVTTVPTFRGEMLIKCATPEAEEPTATPVAAPTGRIAPMCATAFDHVHDLANAFVEANPGREPVEELPSRDRFLRLCNPLPESAQLCLNAPYLHGHKDRCDDEFGSVPERDWLLLERLFLLPPK
jgi:hypothetical protein